MRPITAWIFVGVVAGCAPPQISAVAEGDEDAGDDGGGGEAPGAGAGEGEGEGQGEGQGEGEGEGEGEVEGEGEGEGEGETEGPAPDPEDEGANCDTPIDLGLGGVWKGRTTPPVDVHGPEDCASENDLEHGGHVFRFEVPASNGQPGQVRIELVGDPALGATLGRGPCEGPGASVDWEEERCLSAGIMEEYLGPGEWFLMVDSAGSEAQSYEVRVTVRDPHTGVCHGEEDGAHCPDFGRACHQPIQLGEGGRYTGLLQQDREIPGSFGNPDPGRGRIESTCGGGAASKTFHFEIPHGFGDADVLMMLEVRDRPLTWVLRKDACDGEERWCTGASHPQHAWARLDPGDWYLTVMSDEAPQGGGVPFSVGVGVRVQDAQGQGCLSGDFDGDGINICDGDCDDGDAERHPRAQEDCSGRDLDCTLQADDVRGRCSTGERGVCDWGRPECDEGEVICVSHFGGGPELCGDDLDNDCDGQPDEAGCEDRAARETCELAEDMGHGGFFEGDLSDAHDDSPDDGCGQDAGPEHMLRFVVPSGGRRVRLMPQGSSEAMHFTLRGGDCREGWSRGCFGTLDGFEDFLDEGPYTVVVSQWERREDARYRLSLGMWQRNDEACYTGDADGDGESICAGDCNDGDGGVGPGATEACDGEDTNCDGYVDNVVEPCDLADLNGVCGRGRSRCQEGVAVCERVLFQRREVCGDDLDNDCDGVSDEEGCVDPLDGDLCVSALSIAAGESRRGSFDGANSDLVAWCQDHTELRDVVLQFQVPEGRNRRVRIATWASEIPVGVELRFECRGLPEQCAGGWNGPPEMEIELPPGDYFIVLWQLDPNHDGSYQVDLEFSD